MKLVTTGMLIKMICHSNCEMLKTCQEKLLARDDPVKVPSLQKLLTLL